MPDLLAGVSRNQGRRWTTDEHTRSSIAAMLAAVRASGDDPGGATTAALGQRLRELANGLIAGCRMSGPEHDALHDYLEVLLPRLAAMGGADAALAAAARQDVVAILARFQDYFE
ncbi:MAG: hypothetical protein KF830_15595 [Planctomycetes bacterium]|nr:hypothetical protein [Planctomycetota bacterium]